MFLIPSFVARSRGEFELYRIHVQAGHPALRPGQTRDLKRDITCAAAKVKAVHALTNSRTLKQRESRGPVGASHDFHALLPRDSSMNDVMSHVPSTVAASQ